MDINRVYKQLCYEQSVINDKKEQIAELLTVATNTTMPLSDDKTYTIGGNKDLVGTVMDKVIDLERELSVLIGKINLKKCIMVANIAMLDSPNRKTVAVEKYVHNKSLNQIAKSQDITQNGVCKLLKDTRMELLCKNFPKTEEKT